jgi:phosphatidate cytidylyltransferase
MNELAKRLLVAVIGIPIAILLFYLGNWYFFCAILIISTIALYEFLKLTQKKGVNSKLPIPLIMVVLFEVLIFITFSTNNSFTFIVFTVVLLILIIASYFLLLMKNLFFEKENFILITANELFSIYYVVIPFASLLSIRFMNFKVFENSELEYVKGSFLLIYFATIWLCDSAAYFIGKKWGKHKIATKISPKKSWEGGIAGLIMSIVIFPVLIFLFKIEIPIYLAVLLGFVIGLFGQIGDFLESSYKRDANVKDSSNILSEHGGILDRFDSVMFTAPIILLLLILFSF